jgi:hypothetical protein
VTGSLLAAAYLTERIADAEREVTFLETTLADLAPPEDGTPPRLPWAGWDEGLSSVAGLDDTERQYMAAVQCAAALDVTRMHLEGLRQQASTAAERPGGGE